MDSFSIPPEFSPSAHAESRDLTLPTECPWYSHYEDGVSRSLTYAKVPVYHWLDEAARLSPHTTAYQFMNKKVDYAQLQKDAEIFAANLRHMGVQPGDRVGVMLPNLPQTLTAFWGILKAGAVVVMINPLYMEKELTHQIHDAGMHHLITVDLCWPKLEKLRDQLHVQKYFITRIDEGLAWPLSWLQRFKAKREGAVSIPYDQRTVLPFSVLLKGKERLSHSISDPENTLALLQYTGGTTGVSKGVMLSHYNLTANVQQLEAYFQVLRGKHHVLLGILPFFHVYGLTTCVILPTLLRAEVVAVPRFVPADILKSIEKYKITVFPGAPSVYIALLQQKSIKKYNLSSLEFSISGSAPMPVAYMSEVEEKLPSIFSEGYGLSEASPVTHFNPVMGRKKHGTIGLPLPDTEARIVDMEVGTIPMPPGKVGELIIKGPQVMRGYWNKDDETANTLRNGWLYTGDIAVMDDDGYFSIIDRKKDMIIVGGYNVAPREIDEVLHDHPKVKEAVAVGVPNAARGEIIKAYIVPVEGETIERAEILAWCRERLANYKVPKQVEFRSELPKTLVGKILRRALRTEEESKQSKAPKPNPATGENAEKSEES